MSFPLFKSMYPIKYFVFLGKENSQAFLIGILSTQKPIYLVANDSYPQAHIIIFGFYSLKS